MLDLDLLQYNNRELELWINLDSALRVAIVHLGDLSKMDDAAWDRVLRTAHINTIRCSEQIKLIKERMKNEEENSAI